MRKNIVILILLALVIVVSAAYASTFQVDCEPYISTALGAGFEDWRLGSQETVMRADGERRVKCLYYTYETNQTSQAAETKWRGSN